MWFINAICLTIVTMSVLRTILILLRQATNTLEDIISIVFGAVFGYVIYLAVIGGRLLGN